MPTKPRPKAAFDAALADAKEPETSPHQHEWETAVIAALAHHANSDVSMLRWFILQHLTADAFERHDHRLIFRAIQTLHRNEDSIGRSTVHYWLTQQGETVSDADLDAVWSATAPDAIAVQTFVRHLADRHRLRTVRAVARRVEQQTDAALKGEGDVHVADLLVSMQTAVFDADKAATIVGQDFPVDADRIDDFVLELESRASDKGFVGLDTGFSHLNHVFNGLVPGLYIFAGPPGSGKTTFLKQLADHVADLNAVPVLFFSLEQPAEALWIKSLARLGDINTRDIAKGRMARTVEDIDGTSRTIGHSLEEAQKAYKRFAHRLQTIDARPPHTVGAMRLLAQQARHRAQSEQVVIVIDYLQIVPVDRPKDFATTKDRVDWICSELARLSADLKSPVIAISSENREAYKEGRKPTMAAFKESGGVEYSADVAGALWTNSDDVPQGKQGSRNVTLRILKNRNGEPADVRFIFSPATADFAEVGDVIPLDYADTLKD